MKKPNTIFQLTSFHLHKWILVTVAMNILVSLTYQSIYGQIVLQEVISGKAVISDPTSVKMLPGFKATYGSEFRACIGSQQGQFSSYTVTTPSSSSIPAAGNSDQNFIKTITYREAKTSIPSVAFKNIEEISYFDGLGRPIQKINVGSSPQGKDIVQAFLYDNFGREKFKLFAYATNDKTGTYRQGVNEVSVSSYYSNSSTTPVGIESTGRAYSETAYDNSPLNLVVSQTGPGTAWTAKPVTLNYLTNDEPINGWIAGSDSYTPVTYSSNSLYVTETIDEQGNKNREFKDTKGRIVQKSTWLEGTTWLRTAYIYDDLDLLRCVVPPKANDPNIQDTLCYFYKYDVRKRLIEKRIPDGGTISMVYDKRDRLRCTQNSVQKDANEWSYIQYDALNRPVISGIIKNYNKLPSEVKAALDALPDLNEIMYNLSTYYGYNHLSFPKSNLNLEVQSVTFYDDYNFIDPLTLGDSLKSEKYDAGSYNYASIKDATPVGQVTGSLTRVLSASLESYSVPDQLLYSTSYYDKYGHLLRTISENHLKGKDVISNIYEDITYLITKSKQQHFRGGLQTTIEKSFEYDHTGRILAFREKVNSQPEFTMNALVYNEMGQLITKYIHSDQISGARSFAQKVDFNYNIRGWLTKINDPSLSTENDLFGMQLCYETTTSLGNLNNSSGLFNGNIVGVKWANRNDADILHGYRFSYDRLNRLKASYYADGNNLANHTGFYNENISQYDANGNILKLFRKYDNVIVDSLTYAYTTKSNKILKIADYGTASNLVDDYLETSEKYTYDKNGNMIKDGARKLNITYINSLNLPNNVSDFQSYDQLFYHYTTGGAKLIKHLKQNNGTHTYTHYIGNIVYEGSKLSYIITDEGRLVNIGTNASPNFVYEYSLKDHLGNNRVTFLAKNLGGGALEIVQKTDYYPFGLVMSQYTNSNNTGYSKNKYLYNGKEIQDDNLNGKFFGMLDYGARFYDPQIGRWSVIDGKTEKYYGLTPYAYAANNPILLIDPDGNEIIIGNSTASALTNLAMIAATNKGQQRLDALINSPYKYTTSSVFWTANSSYDAYGEKGIPRTIRYASSVWMPRIQNGSASSMVVMGHEINHAYDHYKGENVYATIARERSSVIFANYLRSVYDDGPMRTVYTGTRPDGQRFRTTFSDREGAYNSSKEKITNFNQISEYSGSGSTFLGFSYDKSEGGGEASTEYMITTRTNDGKFLYVKFDNKEAYEERMKYIQNQTKKKKEDEDK